MMEITESKVFDMVGNVIAGIMANPVHSHLLTNSYELGQTVQNVMRDVKQGLETGGVSIIKDPFLSDIEWTMIMAHRKLDKS